VWFHPRTDLSASPAVKSAIPHAPDDIPSALAAQRDTSRRFLEAVQEGWEVRQVASDMKTRRIRNGYEDKIEDALARRPEKD
jgi:hypothetical protein